jgi:hypothetical protein
MTPLSLKLIASALLYPLLLAPPIIHFALTLSFPHFVCLPPYQKASRPSLLATTDNTMVTITMVITETVRGAADSFLSGSLSP